VLGGETTQRSRGFLSSVIRKARKVENEVRESVDYKGYERQVFDLKKSVH
jgi:hypothetical protein